MGQLVLVVVAAAWAAVLIPPLLRSRLENRPNSSVTDFRNQLHSLQKAMPSRGVTMRSMARPLASSPLSRPAATGRPVLRTGIRTHRGVVADVARLDDGPSRSRSHERPRSVEPRRLRAEPPRHQVPAQDTLKRRRANVLFTLGLLGGCALFLAATMDIEALYYVFGGALLALCAYVYVLGQRRQREVRAAPRPARRSTAVERRTREVHTFQHHHDHDAADDRAERPRQAGSRRRPAAAPRSQRPRPWPEPSRQHRVVQVHRQPERWSAAV